MRTPFLLILFLAMGQHLYSQNDSTATKNGEVINGEIIIEKEKKITLPKANKIIRKVELKSFDSEPLQLDFEIFQPTFNWPDYKSDVPFQSVDKNYPSAKYQSYVKLGFGNYGSPLIDARVFADIEKIKLSTGLAHESFARGPVQEEFSRSSSTVFNLSAEYQAKAFSITPYFEVRNQQYNFYGNGNRINTGFSSENPDEVRYNQLGFGTLIKGANKGFNYYINAKGVNTSQKLEDGTNLNKEPIVQALAGISVKIDTSFRAGFDFEAYSSNYESGISYERSLIQASPWIAYSKNQLSLKGGVRFGSSTSNNTDISGFYPFVNAQMNLKRNLTIYGSIGSGLNWVDLNQLIEGNEFLDDSLTIMNQEMKLNLSLGFNKKLTNTLTVNGEFQFSSSSFFPKYVASDSDSSRYKIIADNDALDIATFMFGFQYQVQRNLVVKTKMKYNLYGHRVDFDGEPWHLPDFELEANGLLNLNEKLFFSSSIILISGISSPKYDELGVIDLPMIFDLNLGFKYLITSRSSVFVDANNLLKKEYERYVGYPVRGLTFKVGGKYRF